ncbi:hypothetical protein V7S43_013411 [Phytophthora oleae]|uniref:Kinesin motor domain-containing protein n=1 Tax=Phytophthora oleae TaxID=2107226 RepID=A0ABD3F4A8_9STRA
MAANVDRGPKGVSVQVHAYVSLPPEKPDNSALRVKDGKQIEVANSSTGETLGLQLGHVYQQATEADVMERSLRPLITACVEGVNVSVLAVGSAKAKKDRVLFSPLPAQSLTAAVFQTLLDALESKVLALHNNVSSEASARKKESISSASFSLRLSFAELLEETITDLLVVSSGNREGNRQDLAIEDDPALGKAIRNLTQSGPLTTPGDFRNLLNIGLNARHSNNGLYGNSSEFSSAVLRISVKQSFAFREAPAQELHSFFDFVDLPATDRLSLSGSAVRLSEGPLLNKSLFALRDVIESLSSSDEASVRYQGSQLTTLLQDALGGNCLTLALLCLSPGDLKGSTSTLQLGKGLSRVSTFPLVNNDILRGLRRRQFMAQKLVTLDPAKETPTLVEFERKVHDLEGKLAQSGLDRRMLREDKDAFAAQLGELRCKYRELFDNELSLRTELLACEQEKLALSKAFVAFQLEKDTQVQQFDGDKFEVETKLIRAEQLVVEIQQDDATKATQIQDLCGKMNELVAEKSRLGGELAMLQKAAKAAESSRDSEAKKNQQLSLELIVAVNQKQKLQKELETLAKQLSALQSKVDTQQTECSHLGSENGNLRQQATELEAKVEAMRQQLVRRELELERQELEIRKEQLETQQAGKEAENQRNCTLKQLRGEVETQKEAFAAEKRSLELQLERVQQDLARELSTKPLAAAALKTKSEENEALLVALERTRHDLQAQLENSRLKLALLHQSGSESGVGVRALRELVASYQVRERELLDELDSARKAGFRLSRRFRDPEQSASELNHQSGEEPHELRERLAAAEQRLTSEMERRSELALALAELEEQNANLKEKRHEEQPSPAQNSDSGVHAIAEMHAALTRQFEEVRRLTLQQTQPVAKPIDSVNSNSTVLSELEALRTAKRQLESRLASTKAHWIKLLEQVERRCAELLTKNVMLTEENESYRKYLTKIRTRN